MSFAIQPKFLKLVGFMLSLGLAATSFADSAETNQAHQFDKSQAIYFEGTKVAMQAKWQDRYNQSRRSLAEKISDEDVDALKKRTANSISKGLKRAFKEAGFNLVGDKSKATYILKAKLTELEVNAPDVGTGPHKDMMVKSAGQGKIHLYLLTTDGSVVAKMTDHQRAMEYSDLRRANRVFNDSEFKRMAARWANQFIEQLNQ